MNCKESFFGIVIEVLACPPESVSFSENLLGEKKYVMNTDYTITKPDATFPVPMKRKSAECSETYKDGLPGISYDVKVSWQVENPDKEDFDKLQNLINNYNHLIIRALGDNGSPGALNRFLVYASEDGYHFEYKENKGVLECELTVLNRNGMQRIFEDTDSTGTDSPEA